MLFVDYTFFLFLPAALLLHRLALRWNRTKAYGTAPRLCLFGLTLVFYGYRHAWWLLPFALSVTLDFVWARLLSLPGKRRRLWLFCSIFQNLGLLAIFKYRGIFSGLLDGLHLPNELPAGISFYTFESLSFVVDVYRREVSCPEKASEFFAFIGMFPRFIAGPIVRYKDMVSQFREYRGMEIERGLFLFLLGLVLKTCFADNFAIFVPLAFDRYDIPSAAAAWCGTFAYTMQLYFDFSGYSLMAIGLGRCLGFRFPDNFRQPYLSSSLREFWRRWHISLSSWLRDYLYIPLGGSRAGRLRTNLNLLITMALGGCWHGSGLPFLAWGLWHGGWLVAERETGAERLPSKVRGPLTFLIVLLGWIFFRAATLREASTVFHALGGLAGPAAPFEWELLRINQIPLLFCTAGMAYAVMEARLGLFEWDRFAEIGFAQEAAMVTMAAFSLHIDSSITTIPFLYFQF